jgi:hypothetical protein
LVARKKGTTDESADRHLRGLGVVVVRLNEGVSAYVSTTNGGNWAVESDYDLESWSRRASELPGFL